jgi:hypothetical protein
VNTTPDAFSGKVWARVIANKEANTVLAAFKSIYEEAGVKIVHLQSDKGNEFVNKTFQAYLESKNIYFHSKVGNLKASLAEYQIFRIKFKIAALLRAKFSTNWPSFLEAVVGELNQTPSEALGGLKPSDFNSIWDSYKLDEALPRARREPNFDVQLKSQEEYTSNPKKYPLQKGTFVLVDNTRSGFEKITDWQRSPQVMEVAEVRAFIRPPMYLLKSLRGVPEFGYFYKENLKITTKPKPGDLYHVEKTLKTRTKNGVEEKLVKFIGFDNSYNEWLPKSQVK